MKEGYSAHHVASYFIYELQEHQIQLNQSSLQNLLKQVDQTWRKVFKTCAFREPVYANSGIYIKEVFDVYKDQFGDGPIQEPAREWYLPYGEFQLYFRPYGVAAFSPFEKCVVNKVIEDFVETTLSKAS